MLFQGRREEAVEVSVQTMLLLGCQIEGGELDHADLRLIVQNCGSLDERGRAQCAGPSGFETHGHSGA